MPERSPPELRGDIAVNGVRYVLARHRRPWGSYQDYDDGVLEWKRADTAEIQEGTSGQPVAATWRQGWTGGMGETTRTSETSQGCAFTAGIDASAFPFARLSGRRVQMAPTAPPADKPTYFREARPVGNAVFRTGTVTASAGTGVQTITHSLGVTPKAIVLWSAGRLADATASVHASMTMGFSDLSTEYSVTGGAQDGVTTTQTCRSYKAKIFSRLNSAAAPTVIDEANYVAGSATTTQFQINWTTRTGGAGLQIHWLVLGGAGLSATVVQWSTPTALGTVKTVTGVGFSSDFVMHLSGATQTTALPVPSDMAFSFGVMDKNGNQWALSANSLDAIGAGTANSSNRMARTTDSCLWSQNGNGAINFAMAMGSMTTDGFTVRPVYIQPAGSAQLVASLCIKGVRVRVSNTTKSVLAATTNQVAETVGFTTTAFIVAGTNDTAVDGSATQTNASLAFGCATSTSQVSSAAMWDQYIASMGTSNAYSYDNGSAAFVKLNNADGATVDAIAVCNNIDMGTAGWLRWTTNDAVATRIFYIALAALGNTADNTPFVYCFNGQRSTKMSVASNVITQEEQKDFGAAAQCGHPAYFPGGGVADAGSGTVNTGWFLPLGASVVFQKLTTVANSGTNDTWTAESSNAALAFATLQDGATARIARGHTTNLVAMSADGTTWASNFQVGNSAVSISSMEDSGTQTIVTKQDGTAYTFDPTGNSVKINTAASSPDNDAGCGLIAVEGTNAALWNTLFALMFYRGDYNKPLAIGPDALKENRAVPNITGEPFRGRWYEIWAAEDTPYMYGLYRVTDSSTTYTYVICLEKRDNGFVYHSYDRYTGILRGMFVDSAKRLWTCFVSDGKIGYWQLGADGSPDPGTGSIGFGAAGTTASLFFPETDFGFPHTLKQHRDIEVYTRGVDANSPISCYVYRDGGSAELVGSTITSGPVSKRYWTLNSNDTSYDTRLELRLATSANSVLFTQGSFVGDGTTARQIRGLGFDPKVVVVKGDTAGAAAAAAVRTDQMSVARPIAGGAASTQGIASLDSNGFSVTYNGADTFQVNTNGVTYYWYALGGTNVKTGSFTGTGASNPVTGVGFAPSMTWIVSTTTNDYCLFRTSTMTGLNSGSFSTQDLETTSITSQDTDGFTVGTSGQANRNAETKYYVCFGTAANIVYGSYTGDGTDDRTIASATGFTNMALQVKGTGAAGMNCVFKTASLAGDGAFSYGSAGSSADIIQTLNITTGNFQVGTNSTVNTNARVYYYWAAGTSTSDYSATSDPQIWAVTMRAFLRPDIAGLIQFQVKTNGTYGSLAEQIDDAKTIRDALKALQNTAPVAYTDPDGNTGNMIVTKVGDLELHYEDGIDYVVAVEATEWINA